VIAFVYQAALPRATIACGGFMVMKPQDTYACGLMLRLRRRSPATAEAKDVGNVGEDPVEKVEN
jgi:hypothetical protein